MEEKPKQHLTYFVTSPLRLMCYVDFPVSEVKLSICDLLWYYLSGVKGCQGKICALRNKLKGGNIVFRRSRYAVVWKLEKGNVHRVE